jgi:DNA-binding transcriptional ArsR family regulator
MCLLAQFFNGFANSTRLSILLLLTRQGETKVGELVRELGAPQPRVSDHLRCLACCGYVKVRREGRNAYYSIADDRVLEMLRLGESILRDNFEYVNACDGIEEGAC